MIVNVHKVKRVIIDLCTKTIKASNSTSSICKGYNSCSGPTYSCKCGTLAKPVPPPKECPEKTKVSVNCPLNLAVLGEGDDPPKGCMNTAYQIMRYLRDIRHHVRKEFIPKFEIEFLMFDGEDLGVYGEEWAYDQLWEVKKKFSGLNKLQYIGDAKGPGRYPAGVGTQKTTGGVVGTNTSGPELYWIGDLCPYPCGKDSDCIKRYGGRASLPQTEQRYINCCQGAFETPNCTINTSYSKWWMENKDKENVSGENYLTNVWENNFQYGETEYSKKNKQWASAEDLDFPGVVASSLQSAKKGVWALVSIENLSKGLTYRNSPFKMTDNSGRTRTIDPSKITKPARSCLASQAFDSINKKGSLPKVKICGTFDGFGVWDDGNSFNNNKGWEKFEQFLSQLNNVGFTHIMIYEAQFLPVNWCS